MRLYIFVLTLFVIGNTFCSQAQVRTQVAVKVKQLCDYIEFMANPENPMDIRNRYRSKAVKLFFANCEPYEEDGIRNEGVAMEVSSIYRSKPTRRLMKDYFMGLINMRYSKVIIQSTDIHDMDVSQLLHLFRFLLDIETGNLFILIEQKKE